MNAAPEGRPRGRVAGRPPGCGRWPRLLAGRSWKGAVLVAALGTVSACEGLSDDLDFTTRTAPRFKAATQVAPPPLADPPQLKVMAWNIKYAAARAPFWFDCWGDQVSLSATEVNANLDALAALIDEVDPDVLVLEEIEVNSRRSAYVDQVRGLLERTRLNYAAYFQTWSSRYVPAEGLGRMDLGMAVLAKHPITEALAIRQDDRTDQDAVTRAFYIHRVVGRAVIDLGAAAAGGGGQVAVYAVHTEAYDVDGTKQKQIVQIHSLLAGEALPWVVGGDFNELPPVAVQTEGFLDERTKAVCDPNFEQPPYTPEVMTPFFKNFEPYLPLARYGTTLESQRRYFTHTVLGPDDENEAGTPGDWNRTLDYLFANPGSTWVPEESDVLQRAGQTVGGTGRVLQADPLRLSDHAPVVGVWTVGP